MMTTKFAFPVPILFLCALAVCGPAWGATAGADAESSVRNILALEKGCGCAEIAKTEIYRREGLDYVASREFAEAMAAVATGASMYAPTEVPASWRTVAAEWTASMDAYSGRGTQVADARVSMPVPEKMNYFERPETCAPALLYLASLEYRARTGNDRIVPVFPRVARASTREFKNGLAFRKGIRCFRD